MQAGSLRSIEDDRFAEEVLESREHFAELKFFVHDFQAASAEKIAEFGLLNKELEALGELRNISRSGEKPVFIVLNYFVISEHIGSNYRLLHRHCFERR